MGFNFRKSIKIGPARINLSKSGVGYSVGAGGFRYTKRAGKKKKSEKKSGGFLAGLIGFIIVVGLIKYLFEEYTAIVFGILAVLAVAAIALAAVFITRKIRSKQEKETFLEGVSHEMLDVPNSDIEINNKGE